MHLVATPARMTVNAGFCADLTELLKSSQSANFAIFEGSILQNLRGQAAKLAIKCGASHLLFIDSDMRFPHDTLKRLLSHNVYIIGANCKQRTRDEWTARKDGQFISSVGKQGIEEVDTIGMGVTLIRTDAFRSLPEPWFSTPFDGKLEKHVGEDVYFCELARDAGISIFIDHDLSQHVRHAGLVEFGV